MSCSLLRINYYKILYCTVLHCTRPSVPGQGGAPPGLQDRPPAPLLEPLRLPPDVLRRSRAAARGRPGEDLGEGPERLLGGAGLHLEALDPADGGDLRLRAGARDPSNRLKGSESGKGRAATANLRTKIPDFRGFDSSRTLILRDGIFQAHGKFHGKFESSDLSGDNLSREIRRTSGARSDRRVRGPRGCPTRASSPSLLSLLYLFVLLSLVLLLLLVLVVVILILIFPHLRFKSFPVGLWSV